MTLKFSKGHGTGNDFVLIYDPKDEIDLTESQVAAICDRSFGIGADGLIKIVRRSDKWFMDYRNSDGSLAEICGNGTRVMSRYLLENKLVESNDFTILTRAGEVKVLVNADSSISVDLGPIVDQGIDITVLTNGAEFAGRLFTAPNPHVVVIVEQLDEAGTLLNAPLVVQEDKLSNGANFEFVQLVGPNEVAMRVYERGVGETLSCGSGACSVAVYMQQFWQTDESITVNVPGGKLVIEKLANQMVRLTGPAVIVASGEFYLDNI